ncbi:hypothetical protein F511_29126 [Dorcoceras hygrometricum]|uniref:Uncharacterized protein n=1 Tax=Dorcoceras hygrometricum TaxID=472368 RepID=A0A2Z7BRE9_9LAMI|nr:hypothetical protein F511_29126 [Dorcoceras hygrometricum]
MQIQLWRRRIRFGDTDSALAMQNQIRRRRFRFGDAESDLATQIQICTDVSVVIWVYGIFRTLSYVIRTKNMSKKKNKSFSGAGSYQEAEDTIQEQHMIIEALVEEKASLVQIIQGLQEDNDAPAPFDDEWEEEAEEEPEEEGLEDIPLGEGEIIEE